MAEFKEIFEAYGANYQDTMGRFMGNETMYLKILDMLFRDKNMELLGKALDAGDMTGAFEAAHTLKGVAANMGLTPLYQAVTEILEPLRAKECRDDYADLYQAIQYEFQKVEQLWRDLSGGCIHE